MAERSRRDKPGVSKVVLYKLDAAAPIEEALADYEAVAQGASGGWDYKVFFRSRAGLRPAWMPLVNGLVPSDEVPRNAYASLVIVFRKADSAYGLAAGYGYASVSKVAVPDFGIDVAQKTLDPNQLAHLIQKIPTGNVYGLTRALRGRYMPVSDPVNQRSVLKALKGKCLDKSIGLSLEGRTSLAVTGKKDLSDVIQLLDRIAALEESSDYTVRIRGLDEAPRGLRSDLDQTLRERVNGADFDDVMFGYDDDLVFRNCEFIRVGRNDADLPYDDVLAILQAARKQYPANAANALIRGYDDQNHDVLESRLFDLIEGELDFDGQKFFRIGRKWYKTNPEYEREIEDEFAAVPTVSSDYFGSWPQDGGGHCSEDEFLEKQTGATKLLSHTRKVRQIEVADLIDTEKRYLIHVKRGRGAYLRNLFAQGFVSASLLRGDSAFRKQAEEKFGVGDLEQYSVVFGIFPGEEANINSVFTLFAKVDYLERCSSLGSLGFDVRYAIIH